MQRRPRVQWTVQSMSGELSLERLKGVSGSEVDSVGAGGPESTENIWTGEKM